MEYSFEDWARERDAVIRDMYGEPSGTAEGRYIQNYYAEAVLEELGMPRPAPMEVWNGR